MTPTFASHEPFLSMPPVLIYTRPMCPYCMRALALLRRKGVAYTEIDDAAFDAAKKREMVQKAGGRSTFPQIFIGERHVGGCDEMMALERSGELDKLLAAA
jgi:glutaredoxin 3